MGEPLLVFVVVALLAFVAWREREHGKQVSELTSKIMARSLNEFSAVSKPEPKKGREEPKKQTIDPVLGAKF